MNQIIKNNKLEIKKKLKVRKTLKLKNLKTNQKKLKMILLDLKKPMKSGVKKPKNCLEKKSKKKPNGTME